MENKNVLTVNKMFVIIVKYLLMIKQLILNLIL